MRAYRQRGGDERDLPVDLGVDPVLVRAARQAEGPGWEDEERRLREAWQAAK